MAEIQLRSVSKRWGGFVGVDNFDLTIADREFLVLLGPSGCGKTTTMRMIAGLEDTTEGEIVIGDRVVNDLDPKDRDVAMVFQSYGLYPNMNVYENIRFPLKVRKVDPSTHDERVRRAVEMVELGDFLHRRPAELSGGQRQRGGRAPAPAPAPPRGAGAASAGGSRPRGPPSASRPCSSWTSPCRTSMRSCASRRGRRSRTSSTSSR